jgi:hypothetical protein
MIIRGRDISVPFPGMPGKFNAITDVRTGMLPQYCRIVALLDRE